MIIEEMKSQEIEEESLKKSSRAKKPAQTAKKPLTLPQTTSISKVLADEEEFERSVCKQPCDHNTEGNHCEKCSKGYFGNAVNGGTCESKCLAN
jgi:hypothetical protein